MKRSSKQVKHRGCACKNGPGYYMAKECAAPVQTGTALCLFCTLFCEMKRGFNHTEISQKPMFGDGF